MRKILVINGPNLNMLGKREETHYGNLTLKDINKEIKHLTKFKVKFYQSNCEGKLVTFIQRHRNYDGYILNLGAYTHTSIAIRDALLMCSGVKVEVHLSCVNSREEFRRVNYISDICDKSFIGEKEVSYYKAINYLNDILTNFEK